jgi:hypothetical protein
MPPSSPDQGPVRSTFFGSKAFEIFVQGAATAAEALGDAALGDAARLGLADAGATWLAGPPLEAVVAAGAGEAVVPQAATTRIAPRRTASSLALRFIIEPLSRAGWYRPDL